ncbi:MAG: TonB family protein [Kofleriaceae bacterium]
MAVGVGLFVTGVWQIDQLDRPRLSIALGQPPPPPPPPAGGPVAAVKNIDVTPKPKPHPRDPVQPYDKSHAKPDEPGPDLPPGTGGPDGPESPCVDNCGPAAPAVAAVCGNNSLEVGEQCDDGNTISNDGCSATCQIEPKPKPPTAVISPVVMNGLRISGDTQVHPSESSQSRMSRDGQTKIVGSVHLCMSTDGSIASVAMAKPTQYDEYDQALLSAVRGWRYRPYTVNGVAVKACSIVTFIYTIH